MRPVMPDAQNTKLASKLLDRHTPGRIHINVVAVAVLARCCVVAVGIALRIHHLIARKPVQRDRSLQVLARWRTLGGDRTAQAEQCQGEETNNRASRHGSSCYRHQIAANLFGSVRMLQIAPREESTALASAGSPSWSRLTTFINSNSYFWRS